MYRSPQITYIGHATVLIEMDGVRILTDPFLRDRVYHLRRCKTLIDPSSYRDLDAVLISHVHLDHLDLPSLRLIGRKTRLIVPIGTSKMLKKHGFSKVDEIYVGDKLTVGSLEVRSTYANHGGKRYPFGLKADSMGFMVDGSNSIYFAGDTDLFPEMENLSDDMDIALLPIWGWGPRLSKGHLNPYRAAKALKLLSPRFAIPIHWGTLHPLGMGWMSPRFLNDPPSDFVRFAEKMAPRVKVHVAQPGSIVDVSGDLLNAPN
ncbi:MBL fold metallo-hydrolase [Desulfobacterota bacterium AH_259_B03_O07]|nr:MBL fold metallo-hydrolase [Desulfobacterota bacterium AH_259_B03_O07]